MYSLIINTLINAFGGKLYSVTGFERGQDGSTIVLYVSFIEFTLPRLTDRSINNPMIGIFSSIWTVIIFCFYLFLYYCLVCNMS